jgi:hypothetical protein
LNTTNQSVWDFAGEGYVHRLALESNFIGGNDSSSGLAVPKMKVTEVDGYNDARSPPPYSPLGIQSNLNNGRGSGGYRSQIAPLSDRQERELLSSKQDQILSHYNQVLQWRLRENSLFYESKIKQIWASVEQSGNHTNQGNRVKKQGQDNSNTISLPDPTSLQPESFANYLQCPLTADVTVSKALIENIKSSLETEKRKLLKQCELINEKIKNAKKENDVAKSLHAALTKNLDVMKDKVKEREDQYRQLEKNLS